VQPTSNTVLSTLVSSQTQYNALHKFLVYFAAAAAAEVRRVRR